MTTVKVNEGDLINVIKKEMKTTEDPSTILISVPKSGGDISRGRNREVFQIVHNEFHSSLSKLGVNVGHYTLKGIKVESIHYPPDRPEVIIVNGEYELPDPEYTGPVSKRKIVESFFEDEDIATSIAVQLNEGELEKLTELQDLVAKARDNMEDVVKNRRV